MSDESNVKFTEREALFYHKTIRPGKIEIIASKPMATQRDLSLAYSPGVAVPVQAIYDNPADAYEYTAKGNLVAVITNGTAILGMGNLGALASKPVMEGKAVLFKRFADVDSIDIELNSEDPDALIEAIAMMEPSFGGINLEDIKAPECFVIEQALRDRMKIPVMHDDQHGTAIIAAAGLVNACFLTGREFKDVKVVVNGAGASALACTALIKSMGVRHENVTVCDTKGVIYVGRAGVDQFKSAHAVRPNSAPCKKQWSARISCSGFRQRARSRRTWSSDGPRSRSSSRWPTPIPRSPRPMPRPCAPIASSPRAVRTIPTRSTTCWVSRSSSGGHSMCGRLRSTRK